MPLALSTECPANCLYRWHFEHAHTHTHTYSVAHIQTLAVRGCRLQPCISEKINQSIHLQYFIDSIAFLLAVLSSRGPLSFIFAL